jgi:hypothetical protein
MWLLKKLTPDFKTISDFRKDNKDAIKKVFKEFIILCKKLDLFGGELVAIDGSKFKAVNSKKRNFNEATLQKKLKDIEEKIETYFEELENNDNSEANVSSHDAKGLKKKIEILKDKVKKRKELAEHPFGTIKRAFNQGYMLLKRLPKVGTEASLSMLAYDITRVINIVGVKKLMAEVATDGKFFLLTLRSAT